MQLYQNAHPCQKRDKQNRIVDHGRTFFCRSSSLKITGLVVSIVLYSPLGSLALSLGRCWNCLRMREHLVVKLLFIRYNGFTCSLLDARIDSKWLDVSRHSEEFIHRSESSVTMWRKNTLASLRQGVRSGVQLSCTETRFGKCCQSVKKGFVESTM